MKVLGADAQLSPEERQSNFVVLVDGRRVLLSRKVMHDSLLVRELLEDSDADEVVEVPLDGLDFKTLGLVHDFLEHHAEQGSYKEFERPLQGDLQMLLDAWDYKFVQDLMSAGSRFDQLFGVLNAANFLAISPLKELCCAAVADLVRDKSENEILELFGIDEPFSAEEEESLCAQYPWLRERAAM